MTGGRDARTNRLLAVLPAADRARLRPHLEPERVELKQLLFEPGKHIDCVYFPATAVISVLHHGRRFGRRARHHRQRGHGGRAPVLALPGPGPRRGATYGRPNLPGGDGGRRSAPRRLQRYVQAFFSQVSQQVACNGLHSIEERCSRWLLLTHDRVGSDEFPLTQEFLSQMPGVRRASVTVAAGMLQSAGFIRYHRGRKTRHRLGGPGGVRV